MSRRHRGGGLIVLMSGPSDTTAPTFTISVVSVTGNVAAMQILASEEVTGFEVGDITISAGGSLASFATADNITFTVNWTLAAGANTMDIAAGVCVDGNNNDNEAATQFAMTYLVVQPDATAGQDCYILSAIPDQNDATGVTLLVRSGRACLLKFDLSGIPAGSTIRSAILTMTLNGTATLQNDVTFNRILAANSAWTEAGATWNYAVNGVTRWAGDSGADGGADAGCSVSGTDYSATVIGACSILVGHAPGQEYAITLNTSEMQSMFASNHGFTFRGTSNQSIGFASSDHLTAGYRPKISIVYTNP